MIFGNTTFLAENYLTLYDNLEFLGRIILAGLLASIIGYERTKRQKSAGIRTHCIIAVTSAVFMILSKYSFVDLAALGEELGVRGADPARIAAQIVTGISFLGAGVIFKNERSSIKGLTTAAGIWGTAALGMAVGAGLYWVGIFETIALFIIQAILHRFPVGNDSYVEQDLSATLEDEQLKELFLAMLRQHNGEILRCSIGMQQDGGMTIAVTARMETPVTAEEAMCFAEQNKGVKEISV